FDGMAILLDPEVFLPQCGHRLIVLVEGDHVELDQIRALLQLWTLCRQRRRQREESRDERGGWSCHDRWNALSMTDEAPGVSPKGPSSSRRAQATSTASEPHRAVPSRTWQR